MPVAIGLAGGVVCGADTGSPVWDKYKPPFKFTGTFYSTTVDVSGELIKDPEARDARRNGAAVTNRISKSRPGSPIRTVGPWHKSAGNE